MLPNAKIIICAISFVLTGCASIMSGTTQEVMVNSNPDGALCKLEREGKIIGTINKTPDGLMVRKTKHDIKVMCSKSGYQDATGFLESGTEGATFGNILLGGVVGWGIDSAAGADNKYPEYITITLPPKATL